MPPPSPHAAFGLPFVASRELEHDALRASKSKPAENVDTEDAVTAERIPRLGRPDALGAATIDHDVERASPTKSSLLNGSAPDLQLDAHVSDDQRA